MVTKIQFDKSYWGLQLGIDDILRKQDILVYYRKYRQVHGQLLKN